MRDFTIEERQIGRDEYFALRAHTTWSEVSDEMVNAAMSHSLYSVIILNDKQPVAMGRIIGDGGLYFYIQDVIVHKNFRGKGLGRMVMEKLEVWLAQHARPNAFIGLMAAEGVRGIYEKFGYRVRQDNAPGMFKLWEKPSS